MLYHLASHLPTPGKCESEDSEHEESEKEESESEEGDESEFETLAETLFCINSSISTFCQNEIKGRN